jgi:Asp-tRNA(Asn)/Glu-tRNA(Gln) amidotransferase A subunit family amidase
MRAIPRRLSALEVPAVIDTNETRRRFLAHFAGIGLSSTLLPGALWAGMQQAGVQRVTAAMMADALKLAGLEFSEEERTGMVNNVNQALTRYEALHNFEIPNDVSPPFHFNPLVPGMKVNRTRQPFRISVAPAVKRPANLEDVAFWSVRKLAELIRSKQVTSVELTTMYLARLKKYNPVLNCVVTFTDDLALQQAKQADAEIRGGRYKGPLHGMPWGAKDIIAAKGYKTTWGSGAYRDQVLDYDATVIEQLREAGAVLIAKLTTGELAGGANWFGGRTNNPWNPTQASGGSSAGPGSATGAGCVGFSIGTETSGSILGPSATCGVTGLRPTLGRISRYGVMALSWTQDRLGPMCRYAEDCAIVMQAIAKPDDRDMSVQDIPFNWNAGMDITKLRVGYVKKAFDETTNAVNKANNRATLDALVKLGLEPIPLDIPDFPLPVQAHDVEMAVFFDALVRSGRVKLMTGQNRGVSFRANRLVPAVEYLQSQRARMMMMMRLAKATESVDVFLIPRAGGGGGGRGGAGGGGDETPGPGGRGGGGGGNTGPINANTQCNLATYPALAVPNGFSETGTPTSMTFLARPFGETELLAVAKAYQDATGHHLKHPTIKT